MSSDESFKKRAEHVQQHGGAHMPTAGRIMEQYGPHIGSAVGAAIPTGGIASRIASSVFGSAVGAGLAHVGGALKNGLPVNRSQYDIMRTDFKLSHTETLRHLSNNKSNQP